MSMYHLAGGNNTRQRYPIIDHVVQLIELSLQPPVQKHLILVYERRNSSGQNLRALFQVIDVVHAEQ
jgi:hypothetical protein